LLTIAQPLNQIPGKQFEDIDPFISSASLTVQCPSMTS